MSKLNVISDPSGIAVVKLDELQAYLKSLSEVAYWRSGEQLLQTIHTDVESSRPSPTATMVVS